MASDKKAIDSLSQCLEVSILGPIVHEQLAEWIKNNNSISIFVSGKTGTGKSTLINGIIGESLTKEGHKLTPETSKVNKLPLKIKEVDVSIFDTPGLEDKTQQDDTYIAQMKEVFDEVDLFLYCIKMSETRFFKDCDDAIAMNRVTKALGEQIWENGLIVLTYANGVVSMARDRGENVSEYFQKKYLQMAKRLREFLQDIVKVPAEIATSIPIVCAGHVRKPQLPSIAPEHLEASVHIDTHWLSYLWLKALRRTKVNAQPAMIKLNLHRIYDKKEYSTEEMFDTVSEIIEMHPLMLRQQGAEICKDFGENGEKIGELVGENFGRRIAVHMGINVVFALLIHLALEQGIIIRVVNE